MVEKEVFTADFGNKTHRESVYTVAEKLKNEGKRVLFLGVTKHRHPDMISIDFEKKEVVAVEVSFSNHSLQKPRWKSYISDNQYDKIVYFQKIKPQPQPIYLGNEVEVTIPNGQ